MTTGFTEADMQGGGVQAIARERARQITEEGYTAEHDAQHSVDDFVATAVGYLGYPNHGGGWVVKRTTLRGDLVKAGALIAAAIDRDEPVDERVEKVAQALWIADFGRMPDSTPSPEYDALARAAIDALDAMGGVK